jgi:putative hydrolase of the HAD superfamily
MATSIRFIYFDLGNVLLNFCHDRMCRQMAEAAQLDVQRVREVVLSDTALRQHETGALNSVTFHEYFCRETGTSVAAAALHAAASDIFALNVAIVPIVERLASAGRRLGILSNTNEAHWRFVSDGRFAPLLPGPFEQVVLSFEERAMKPDPAIYEAAAHRAGVAPSEIFFTDDRAENVAGAKAAGFDAVLFTGPDQVRRELSLRGACI